MFKPTKKKETKEAPEPSLKQRIEAIRAEVEQMIDRKVAELKIEAPNLPVGVLRMQITNRGFYGPCHCHIAQSLTEGD